MRRNESYTGVNALFRLPVDESKADPAAAEAYLKALDDDTDQMEEPVEKDAVDLSVEAFMEKLTPENIDEYAAPVEATRQTCTVDEDGLVHYSYKTDNDEGSVPCLAAAIRKAGLRICASMCLYSTRTEQSHMWFISRKLVKSMVIAYNRENKVGRQEC